MKAILSVAFLALLFIALNAQTTKVTVNVPVTIYDHYPTVRDGQQKLIRFSPDFQPTPGTFSANVEKNMVSSTLNGPITYVGKGVSNTADPSNDAVWSKDTFATWFKNTPNVNIPILYNIPFQVSSTVGVETKRYQFGSNSFFPIDGKGFCNTSIYNNGTFDCSQYKAGNTPHNFHFCFEWSGYFQYREGKGLNFTFTGDDDVWVYFNKKLEIDIGGIHDARSAWFAPSKSKGYTDQEYYDFNFFYCERKTTGSNINIDTNLDIKPEWVDYCGANNGDGSSCCKPDVDCNDNNGCTIDSCPDPRTPAENWRDKCVHKQVVCSAARGPCYNNTCDPTLSNGSGPNGRCPANNENFLCGASDACTIRECNSVGCQTRPKQTCTPNKCQESLGCDPVSGCQFKNISSTCIGTDPCYIYSCNVESGCSKVAKTFGNPPNRCQYYTCGANGQGVLNTIPNCVDCGTSCDDQAAADKCNIYQCTGINTCSKTPVSVEDNNKCTIDACNATTGAITHTPVVCEAQSLCHEQPTCNAATGTCSAPVLKNCNDGNECTTDSCGADGKCVNTPIDCDDQDGCTIDTCDPYTAGGCKNTRKECPVSNLCEEGYCSAGECKTRPLKCPTKNFCDIPRCNEKVGCVSVPRQCASTNDCSTGSCNYDRQKCEDKPFDPLPFRCQSAAVKTGVAIGSAATAGIVIAGAVALGMAVFGGKKGYDYWKQSRDTKMSAAVENPLFEASNNSKENPLFENQNA